MKRKMAYIGIGYFFGLFLATFITLRLNAIIALIFGIIAILHIAFFGFKSKLSVVILSVLVGFLVNISFTTFQYQKVMKFDKKIGIFTGVITDYKSVGNEKAIYTLKGKFQDGTKAEIQFFYNELSCEYYDTMKIKAEFEKYEDTIYFESFGYNKAKGIFIQAKKVIELQHTENKNFSINRTILNYRDYIYQRIISILPNEEGAFLSAMLCGDTSNMSPQLKSSLYRSGIGHIFAVSGTHLVVVCAIFVYILQRLNFGKITNFVLTEGFILAFVVFAGMSNSVIRSAIMLTIVFSANMVKRRADVLNSLGICAIILTVQNPFAVRDASLLLSMCGVFAVGHVAPSFIKKLSHNRKVPTLVKCLIATFCASICTFPFALIFFSEFSLISPISNLLLIPLCTLALTLTVIVALTGGVGFIAYPLLTVAGVLIKVVIKGSEILNKIPFSYIPLGYKFLIISVIIGVVSILIITFIAKKYKLIALTTVLSIALIIFSATIFNVLNADNTKLAIITEGKNTALIVYTGSKCSIFELSGKGDLAQPISRFVSSKGIKDIELLFINESPSSAISSYTKSLLITPKVLTTSHVGNNNGDFYRIDAGDSVKNSKYEFTVISEGQFLLNFDDKNILLTKSDDEVDFAHDVVFDYLDGLKILNSKGTYENLEKNGGTSYLLDVGSDGILDIRRLDYAYRE